MNNQSVAILKLRRLLLAVLSISVVAFTIGVFVLVQRIFDNFGPGVRLDLEWKTIRGAQELASESDLGLAVRDGALVRRAFRDYVKSDDVVAIVAQDVEGKVVASHRSVPTSMSAFGGGATILQETELYMRAWAPATIEGSPVGRVALVVSKRRLVQSERLLSRISLATGVAGGVVLISGIVFVMFFTGTIAQRDAQLAQYASQLEVKIKERTAELDRVNGEMRLVLDNVEQGFVTVSPSGVMSSERSAIVDTWLAKPAPGTSLADALRPWDPECADWMDVGMSSLREGMLPLELVIDQLPKKMALGDRTMRFGYKPIMGAGDQMTQLLVILTDVTDELARERLERDSREMGQVFRRITRDRAGFAQFFEEATGLVAQVMAGGNSREIERRLIHTLKGNAALNGVDSIAELCHRLETILESERRVTNQAEREGLQREWIRVTDVVGGFLGDGIEGGQSAAVLGGAVTPTPLPTPASDHLKMSSGVMEALRNTGTMEALRVGGERRATISVEEDELRELIQAIDDRASPYELIALLEAWRDEPVSVRLWRLAEKARYLSKRLGKPEVVVHCEAGGVRLSASRWQPFWAAMVHAVSNAVDHGIEDPATRKAGGKPERGELWLGARRDGHQVTITVRDDGRGIDWSRVAESAARRGLPNDNQEALVAALFADGVTTREVADQTSGRGVGMGALNQATAALGGRIEVQSEPGRGTTFQFRFDLGATVTRGAPGVRPPTPHHRVA